MRTHNNTEETFENIMQSSQQILNDNIQYLAHLDRLASELVAEQEKGSFST